MLAQILDHLSSPWQRVSREQLIAALVAIALLALCIARDDDGFLFLLDHANLAFHEAGHPIYGILGPTMALYGGTLGQLTFPTVVVVSGLFRRLPGMFAAGIVWLGQNLINIARYMADARAQELPLVGGGEHDWLNIFTRWHVLQKDVHIAAVTRHCGWALILVGAAFLIWRWRRSGIGEVEEA